MLEVFKSSWKEERESVRRRNYPLGDNWVRWERQKMMVINSEAKTDTVLRVRCDVMGCRILSRCCSFLFFSLEPWVDIMCNRGVLV